MIKISIQKNNRWVFNALTALLMLLIVACHVFEVALPEVVLLALTLAMICTCKRDHVLATLIMCIPMSMIFGTTYTFIAGFAMWILLYRDRICVNLTIIPILLLIIWELPHCIEEDVSIKWIIAEFIPFAFCGLLMWQDVSKVDYGFVVRCLAVCTVTMCLTMLGMTLMKSNFDIATAFLNMQRLGFVTEDNAADVLRINPNTLGIICVLSITGLLQLSTTGRGKITDVVMALTMMICGALTLSKTFLMLLAIMAVLFWLSQEGGVGKRIRFILMTLLLGALAVVVLYAVFPVAVENFINRFMVADITSGRTELLRTYNKLLYSHSEVLMFGIGLTNYNEVLLTQYAVASDVPHNGIQEVLIAWGIPGSLLYLVFLGTLVWNARKNVAKQSLLNYIPLLILAGKIMVGQMLTSNYTMLAFAYCYLSLTQNFEQNRGESPTKRKFYKKMLDN